ncbi:nitric oxide reductase transcriptional regulator NorR [Pseudoalteromonas sp. MB41]|uniref:nitric oxide reductase transcriptional regulator NorR n=1 Tax=Pseudoalteromonas sp. MB41 TaxID=2896366 RepID=UPI001E622DA9|nr:nitric oxide reductase transcriptional regulator NorR [Pseudoalteromonas sp. MB41]MCC9661685.1 nitric oxide reductase transcriptional regulator NorR [Pseudoalteromonas sp. MB41]
MTSQKSILDIALALAHVNPNKNDFSDLLSCISEWIHCDAVALLIKQGETLKPVAQRGLSQDTLGRRFEINEHPRLFEICRSTQPLKFAKECELPDPYDGLLQSREGDFPVHACMGLPLYSQQQDSQLLAVLTFDSLNEYAFDDVPHTQLTQLMQLVAAHVETLLTVQHYQQHAQHNHQLAQQLNLEALTREGVEIIGNSHCMQILKNDIQLVAASEFSVLIQGDTGVGKELVARNIHLNSKRREQPLIHLNCASLPENLAESEFFGHSKGAFTGAHSTRQGKFQLADGGTLFLDEIGELPLAMQSKLLRVLQSGEVQTVGEDQSRYVDVRVIAATNRDLKQEVAEGRFRADLYHRLRVYPLNVPALKERENDVILLAGFFVEQTARKLAIKQLKLSIDTQILLRQYDWPGNVRELEHVISRAALKAKQQQWQQKIITIEPQHCDIEKRATNTHTTTQLINTNTSSLSLKEATDAFSYQMIMQQLEQHNLNWAATARTLKVDRANLVRLAKRLGINVKKSL